MTAITLSTQTIISALVDPLSHFGATQLTYSVPGAGSTWPNYDGSEPTSSGYSTLNATQAAQFVNAMTRWDAYIAASITQTNDTSSPGAIRVAFTDESDPSTSDLWGYTIVSGAGLSVSRPSDGDIWISVDQKNSTFANGSYDYMALMHEIGHALGLKHPFEDGAVLPTAYDNINYTIMSYSDASPANQHYYITWSIQGQLLHPTYNEIEPVTPMVMDILAVQSIYGASTRTNVSDNTYSYTALPYPQTIYDSAGIDTIDTSTLTRSSDIDLTPGSYSSIDIYTVAQQINAAVADHPGYSASEIAAVYSDLQNAANVFTGANNVGIAYGTVIENAIGGSGNDSILGNSANNALIGGAGNDYIRGLDGDDLVYGGDGNDDVNGNQGQDIVHGDAGADTVRGGQGNDSVFGDDGDDGHVNGNIGDDTVSGGNGNDTVFGGQGNDILHGDAGDDSLSGDLGNDTLYGDAGADRFTIRAGGGVDWVADFKSSEGDVIQLDHGTAYTVTSLQGQAAILLTDGSELALAGISSASFNSAWVIVV